MTVQPETPNPRPTLPTPHSPMRKIGIGVVLVAIPVAAGVGVFQLQQREQKSNDDLERGFRYDDSALRKVDPALIGYTEVGQIQAGMQKPTCMSVGADGKLYVAGEQLARVMDAKGRELLAIPLTGVATAIAASPTGDIYIAVKTYVEVYSAEGKRKAAWTSLGRDSHITAIAAGDDAVYLADAGRRAGRVVVCGLDGAVKSEIAGQNAAAGIPGIITPSAHMKLALTPEGSLWVANPGRHQLELYSPAGELLKYFGQGGTTIEQFLGCCNPSDFALLADGRIVTAEKGVPRVKVYQPDGHMVSVVAGPDSFGGNRSGLELAADSSGRVLVLEPGTSTIRLFAEKHS